MQSTTNEAQQAQLEFRKKQEEFISKYHTFLQGAPFELRQENSQLAGQKMMMNTARLISGKNLEDLDDLTQHYILKE